MNRRPTFENESTKATPTGKYIFGTFGILPQYDDDTQCVPNGVNLEGNINVHSH